MAVVYKYRKADKKAWDILRTKSLWLSAPADFTDKSDMAVPIQGLFDSPLDVVFRGMVQKSLEQNPAQNRLNVIKEKWSLLTEGNFLEKLRSGKGHAVLDEVRQEAGVISFGATGDNDHLWHDYADDDKGLSFGFETKHLGYKAHAVSYVPRSFVLSLRYFESNREELRKVACLIKYVDWQAEDEVRIIIPRKARAALEFRPKALVSVTLGTRIRSDQEAKLRKIVARNFPHAQVTKRCIPHHP